MLLGKKIVLEPLEKEDLAKSRLWVNDASLSAKMLRALPVTRTDQEKWYQNIIQDPSKLVFAIKMLDSEEHIGNTGLYHIDWINRRAEFWILLGEMHSWQQGIGSEIVFLMQEYAFNNLNLNKLYLNVDMNNKEAIGLYKKLKFVQEGILKDHYYIEGKYLDIITMAILRKDFRSEE